ncbi:MAG: hypothetical protein JNK19_08110 [Tabrizicola sp.]|nr:hypothetical protein [Tabrizicola sp.]
MLQGQLLAFKPSAVVAERISTLGRTEDVIFSPDQTRLAIAGYNENRILVIQVEVVTENGAMTVLSDGCVELRCQDFDHPHGISWIDDDTVVIANRGKDVIVLSVPAVSSAGDNVEVEPLLRLSEGSDEIIKSPGSVAVTRLSDEYFDCLVCNNYRNYISRHIIRKRNGFEVVSSLRLFEHGLKVPDSIAISAEGDLVAVSNHHRHRIDVFSNDAGSATHSPPVLSLGGLHYPHGVRFAMDDRLLLVADAGAPLVHVYARGGPSWKAASGPDASIRVIDEESFRRGHKNPEEGGPKGLDTLADGSVLVVSCEEVPIAFFDFRTIRDQLVGPAMTDHRESRSGEARMLETALSAMRGQHDQMKSLQAEIGKLKAMQDRRLDRRLLRLIKGWALKKLAEIEKR